MVSSFQSFGNFMSETRISKMKKNRKNLPKIILLVFLSIFVFMNIIAYFHAYKFTHFVGNDISKTDSPEKLSDFQKLKILLTGLDNPRPTNTEFPKQDFETIKLKSNKEIECWSIRVDSSKGTVIIFHGFSGQKSSMLDKSDEFLKLGYSTFLVDFMGSGGSEGNQTTMGFYEAEQVKTCFDYLHQKGEKNICLFGTSMGAVAILKAIDEYKISPSSVILECPFGSMYETVCARFKTMNVPSFPMAGLLVFWGGIQNGFWAFGHNPANYAKSVHYPTLLLYGEVDKNVSRKEIDEIFENLNGKKRLVTFPLAGHENYLIKYKNEWIKSIDIFLSTN